jgi:hypothetical protein
MFKILIVATTREGGVHTRVIEFDSQDAADLAFGKIRDVANVDVRAIKLY